MLIAFNKPYGVISQFTDDGSSRPTLAGFGFPKNVYSLGRLDRDSEGLLLLSDEPELNQRLLHPNQKHRRVYWAQVERVPDGAALKQLESGVIIRGNRTLPCKARLVDPAPVLWPRNPPIRFRKNVPDAWIALELIEGKNRQVRHMTAAIGHPTLRLVRVKIGDYEIGELQPGEWVELDSAQRKKIFAK